MTEQEERQLIIKVLETAKPDEPTSVATALFGQNFPQSGSRDDLMVKEIEGALIYKGLVTITEQGGTNKTLNGYAHFIPSAEGRNYLNSYRHHSITEPNGVIHGLSILPNDKQLIDQGLSCIGIQGYILTKQKDGSVPLHWFQITFGTPKNDNLYTTSTERENIADKNPRSQGIIGYVYTNQAQGTMRLRRLFGNNSLDHLYITRFIVFSDDPSYDDESTDNPMFIDENEKEDTKALFLYSNVPAKFEYLYDDNLGSLSLGELETNFSRTKKLSDIIEKKKINISSFSFSQGLPDDGSITVSLKDTLFNFYIDLQDNHRYYTVRINPNRRNGDYLFNDVESWKSVLEYFDEWLDAISEDVKRLKNSDEFSSAKGVRFLEGASSFTFRNGKIKAALNVDTQAQIFLRLLDSIPFSEHGLLLGIFGQWGRGKTYFWERLVQLLNIREAENLSKSADNRNSKGKTRTNQFDKEKGSKKEPETIFEPIEFYAWKYQDTPASWAYLYEVFVKAYYNRPRKIWLTDRVIKYSWLNKVINIFLLNVEKAGWFKFIFSIVALIYGFVWYFFLSLEFKWALLSSIVTTIGIGTLASMALYYYFYSGTARGLIRKYFSDSSYQNLLGIQAEIQEELKTLLKAWIPDGSTNSRRILLFVDDVDRCNEERIIRIVDSLKVMMDDHFISQRVMVISAVDETVLKRAINLKYSGMVNSDLSLSSDAKRQTLDRLCREYMDKLFISGFRLGNLSQDEKVEFVKNVTEGRVYLDSNRETFTVLDTNEDTHNVETNPQTKAVSPSAIGATGKSESEKYITMLPKPDFEIMGYELEYIQMAVGQFRHATPRSIRIFYYRYLLAKHFKDIVIANASDLYYEWKLYADKEVLCYLILEYGNVKTHSDLIDQLSLTSVGEEPVSFKSLDREFNMTSRLYKALLKIVEIVVPY